MRGRGAGGIIGLVVVLAPYVLRFAGIVLIIAFAIWELGKLVTCAQQKLPSTNAENGSPDKVNATVGRLNATVFPRRAFSLPDVHLTCT